MEKRGLSDWKNKLKVIAAKLMEKLKKVSGMSKVVLAKIQAKIAELMKSEKFLAIAKYIRELIDQYFPQ